MPGDEVPGEVRQAERLEQLARQRSREEEEADGGDRPEAAVHLGDGARHVEDQRAEAREEERVRQVHADAAALCARRAAHRAAPAGSLDACASPRACALARRSRRRREERARRRAGPDELADRRRERGDDEHACRRPAREPERERQADAHRERAGRRSDSPTSGPALRAGFEMAASSQPTRSFATTRAAMAAAAIQGSRASRGSRRARRRGGARGGGRGARSAPPSRAALAGGATAPRRRSPMKKQRRERRESRAAPSSRWR